MPKILIIDDDPDLRALLHGLLKRMDFAVIEAPDGRAGLEQAALSRPDAVILDVMMPGMTGMEVLRKLRADSRTRQLRVLMLSAHGDTPQRVVGLNEGADDYLPKPFEPQELAARLNALLRRETPKTGALLRIGPLTVDFEAATVRCGDVPVILSVTEFKLLRTLAEAEGKVLSRERLRDLVWGVGHAMTPHTIDVHMKRLRGKLGAGAEAIKTVRGQGYKLEM
jgi:two-component system phosphate regulon response regulator PhoB